MPYDVRLFLLPKFIIVLESFFLFLFFTNCFLGSNLEMHIVTCYFKEKINAIVDKWLVAETSAGHMFDLSLMKEEAWTFICDPF